MNRTEAIKEIKSRYAEYLKPAKKRGTYICPLCNNGTGSTGDGLAVDPHGDGQHLKCFKCGLHGDVIEIYRQEHSCTPAEAINGLCAYFGLQVDGSDQDKSQRATRPAARAEPTEDYTALYAAWHQALLQTPTAVKYLADRGINRATIDRFNMGYCPDWSHPAAPAHKSPRIIIPRSAHGYTARRVDGETQYKYQVVGQQGDFFNAAALDAENKVFPVLVVEGELDAAAIVQAGYEHAIGLGSTANRRRFVAAAKEINPAAVYILALDNDDAGREAQKDFEQLMTDAGLSYISADPATLYGDNKDAADAALKDLEGFCHRLMDYAQQGIYQRSNREKEAEREAYYRSGPGMVDSFLQEVKGERYRPLPTGIKAIDDAIGGGLYRQTIVMLGAAPGMGKTALASQICESIAKTGAADVLYINLEMSREQLLARSLARIAYLNGEKDISATDVLQGYRWTIDTEEAVHEAADQYKATTAQHLLYNPGEDTTDLDAIIQKMESEKARLGHAPIVAIDYLQLLTGNTPDGRSEDSVATVKRAVQRFKEFAIREDTTVIIITANNRDSMRSGDSDLNSGRDTSNIEYGADLHLGIVYTATAEGGKDLREIRAIKRAYWKDPKDPAAAADYEQFCTRYTLKVNKNRHGAEGREAVLHFNGACALFIPEDSTHTDPRPIRKI